MKKLRFKKVEQSDRDQRFFRGRTKTQTFGPPTEQCSEYPTLAAQFNSWHQLLIGWLLNTWLHKTEGHALQHFIHLFGILWERDNYIHPTYYRRAESKTKMKALRNKRNLSYKNEKDYEEWFPCSRFSLHTILSLWEQLNSIFRYTSKAYCNLK